ncbi:hypothetical protein CEQ90_16750 [Lewinellaceae bacterium SD302]|nr:hypothetical protein CEQ90_16750 [Lewinellaceae bacterium SD302]
MHPNLSQAILQVLTDEGQVALPRFGTFRLQAQPAMVSTIEGRSRPPSKRVDFNANLKLDDGRLARYLREYPLPGPESAEDNIDKFVTGLHAEIDAGRMVTLEGIGRLFRDHTGEIRFNAGDYNLDKSTFGLPDVALAPIIRTERNPVSAPTAGQAIPTTIPSPNSLREMQKEPEPLTAVWGFIRENIWIIALVTGVIFVTGWSYVYWRDGKAEVAKMERQLPPPPNDRVNVPPPKVNDIELPETSSELPEQPPVVNQSPPANNLPPEEGTAVIGLYRLGQAANVRKNVRRISEAGYEPYTRESNQLTRVGVQVRFKTEQELKDILTRVRREFTPDAFILEKNGVRYE